ncbi:hypothetical protein ACPUVO_10050 [Pseudocolwellia sp. HL-MZ19]|uniref:hypothetical protein n=1 Tax=Pseudocolwellia sp. HL-MZ19 TaxID=3400846 RepID=UPI003CE94E7B
MSWAKLDTHVNAHSLITVDGHSCKQYGVSLSQTFPFHKVNFTCQALAMLSQLNDFDQQMVEKEIKHICAHPNAKNSIKHSRNPLKRLWRTQYPFRNYHYLVEFSLNDNQIVIDDVLFDRKLVGPKDKFSAERTMLYQVDRLTSATYNKAEDKKGIEKLQGAWRRDPKATTQVNTTHAAVNGMLNELDKAAWLMGTHLDTAYQSDKIKAYTLFHNPTDKGILDIVECAFDKRQGNKSHNAQHLAAVLAQNHQQGKKVKWLVHSQGAIIFCAALEHYRIHYRDKLTTQEVAVHGSGANIKRFEEVAERLGMTISSIRNNPYDLVPNLGGFNDTSASSLVRSMKFKGAVFGKNSNPGVSPHTLPFLGLITYADQLQLFGDISKATVVRKFINGLPKGDSRL